MVKPVTNLSVSWLIKVNKDNKLLAHSLASSCLFKLWSKHNATLQLSFWPPDMKPLFSLLLAQFLVSTNFLGNYLFPICPPASR